MEPQRRWHAADSYDQPLPFNDELRLLELRVARERLRELVENVQSRIAALHEQREERSSA